MRAVLLFFYKIHQSELLGAVTTQWAWTLHFIKLHACIYCFVIRMQYLMSLIYAIQFIHVALVSMLCDGTKIPLHETAETYRCCLLSVPLIDLHFFSESHLINTRLELHLSLELTHCFTLITASYVHLIAFLYSYKFRERSRFLFCSLRFKTLF